MVMPDKEPAVGIQPAQNPGDMSLEDQLRWAASQPRVHPPPAGELGMNQFGNIELYPGARDPAANAEIDR